MKELNSKYIISFLNKSTVAFAVHSI